MFQGGEVKDASVGTALDDTIEFVSVKRSKSDQQLMPTTTIHPQRTTSTEIALAIAPLLAMQKKLLAIQQRRLERENTIEQRRLKREKHYDWLVTDSC